MCERQVSETVELLKSTSAIEHVMTFDLIISSMYLAILIKNAYVWAISYRMTPKNHS